MSVSDYLTHLFSYEDQIVIVIGGTGVLGGALCDGFGKAGGHVVVAGRSEERGLERVKAIQDAGGSAEFITVDVFQRESIQQLRDQVLEKHGKVDVLVNCAGMNAAIPYEEITDEDWDWIMDGNLRSTQIGCQLFAMHMKTQNGGGCILNIGSVPSHLPLSKVFAYSASKAAVVNLTKNVAREYGTQGVRVNAICPGFFPAEQNRKILAPERIEKIMSQTPMDRFGEPQELIGAALLLCSRNAGSFITGADYYVDGGFTANRF
ncbi:MAG: gluconate 5-dehydrogenase [Planctomycetaceae bacterium]|nr:gluconate 5-dehydrogenase [Planctomycetaceae bacterium]